MKHIHSSIDEHLSCIHVFAIVNSAAVNIGVHISFRIRGFFSPDICQGVGLLGDTVVLFLVFLKEHPYSSIVAAPIYIATKTVGRFLFSTLKGNNLFISQMCQILFKEHSFIRQIFIVCSLCVLSAKLDGGQ